MAAANGFAKATPVKNDAAAMPPGRFEIPQI